MDVSLQWIITFALFVIPILLFWFKKISLTIFIVYLVPLLLISIVLPLIFHFSLALQRGVLYFYFVDRPEEGSLKHPERFGLRNVRNFYIQNKEITLGVWQFLPDSYPSNVNRNNVEFLSALRDGAPVILYVHGNIGSRATDHRLHLYNNLQQLGYHVITFDYRGFGDSTYGTPHEAAVVSDCLTVAKWLITFTEKSPVFFWGHSLGSGMTTRMAAILASEGFEAKGVILQSPFDNMPSEIRVHPFGTIFRIFPWYNILFSDPYYTNGEDFFSSKYILQFAAPILILHAEDDPVIPSELGWKLYNHGLKNRESSSGPLSIKVFDANRKLGHGGVCTAPELPLLIRNFVSKYKDRSFSNDCNIKN